MTSACTSRLEFALKVSQRAADFVLQHFRSRSLGVETKSDDSPVTIADRGAEQMLRDAICNTFPDDAVLGEEFDDQTGSSGFRWIIDPIDGTKPFIYGVPLFGMLIGLEHNGRMVAGVCRLPAMQEVVYAAEGQGAWWQIGQADPVAAQASTVTSISEARLMFTEPTHDIKVGRDSILPRFLRRVRFARGWGDCLGHILVATGRADIALDPEMSPWDIAALIPILREAGASCTDWKGHESVSSGDGVSVVSGLREEVLSMLQDAPPLASKTNE